MKSKVKKGKAKPKAAPEVIDATNDGGAVKIEVSVNEPFSKVVGDHRVSGGVFDSASGAVLLTICEDLKTATSKNDIKRCLRAMVDTVLEIRSKLGVGRNDNKEVRQKVWHNMNACALMAVCSSCFVLLDAMPEENFGVARDAIVRELNRIHRMTSDAEAGR